MTEVISSDAGEYHFVDTEPITIVTADDWIGIYVGEDLKYQGHSIDARDLLDVLNIPHRYKHWDAQQAWEEGRLPPHISDVLAYEDYNEYLKSEERKDLAEDLWNEEFEREQEERRKANAES